MLSAYVDEQIASKNSEFLTKFLVSNNSRSVVLVYVCIRQYIPTTME